MKKKIAIQTLSCDRNDEFQTLKLTVKTFYENYKGNLIDWYLYLNGFDSNVVKKLNKSFQIYSDKFSFFFIVSNQNMGVGFGLNRLNDVCKEYEYTFLLEDDWVCLPYYMSGHSENWFWNSIKLLDDNKNIDQIQFRRYLDDLDDRQYGYSYWLKPENVLKQLFNGDEFLLLNKREYTNNPSLRRMKALYDKKIFPLYEAVKDGIPLEIKGNDEWGIAEIKAMENNILNCAWLYLGNFVHYQHWYYKDNFKKWKDGKFGCCVYEMSGWNTCKYGYLFPGHYFCGVCEKDKEITHLEQHSHVYLEEILPLEHKLENNNIIINKIKKLVKNPTINSENYINKKIYLNNRYYRGEE